MTISFEKKTYAFVFYIIPPPTISQAVNFPWSNNKFSSYKYAYIYIYIGQLCWAVEQYLVIKFHMQDLGNLLGAASNSERVTVSPSPVSHFECHLVL